MTQILQYRTDLFPHYSRLIAILNHYMPDIGSDIVATVSDRTFPCARIGLTMWIAGRQVPVPSTE